MQKFTLIAIIMAAYKQKWQLGKIEYDISIKDSPTIVSTNVYDFFFLYTYVTSF